MTKSERKTESGERRRTKPNSFWQRFIQVAPAQQRLLLIVMLAALLTIVIVPKGGFIPDYYGPGDIASRDIKAPRDALIEDEALTKKSRQEARAAVLPLYDFDSSLGRTSGERLKDLLKEIQRSQAADTPLTETEMADFLAQELEISLSPAEVRAVRLLRVDDLNLEGISQQVQKALAPPIVGNLKLFKADSVHGIILRDLTSQQEFSFETPDQVVGLGEAQDQLRSNLQSLGLDASEINAVNLLSQPLVRPNLTFNSKETEQRRETAMAETAPVLYQIKKGEMIVREGERVTERQILKLTALRDLGKDGRTQLYGFGLFLATVALFFVGHNFARVNIKKFKPDNRDLLFLACSYLGLFVLIKIAIFIATALGTTLPEIETSTYYYVIPFAMGSMLVRLVLNSEIALMFAIIGALLVGVLFGNNLPLAIFVLTSSLAGAHGVRHCKERSTLYRAGMRVALVNMVMVLAIHFIAGYGFELQMVYKLLFAFFGGLLSAVFVNGTVPLIESLFKYTTDIKLLEMANLNAPILRELMVQAPGTYHHAVIVGNLVESAAEAINANPLLARVSAYYHDIGKMRKPLYFIENADGRANRHDKLAPSMSALILMAHVKDGVEMAREHKLGKEIIDVIQQHHGTTLIKFFYDKAQNLSDPEMEQIKESDYRYPGPKPQTREAALIMLADAIEAASRTLSDPTPARIQGMVQKIINSYFIDGQLDECELTLKDLHVIAKSFNRILSGIFHNRIDYPEPAYKERDRDATKKKEGESARKNGDNGRKKEAEGLPNLKEVATRKIKESSVKKKDRDDPDREPTTDTRDRDSDTAEGSKDDLKRLGMS